MRILDARARAEEIKDLNLFIAMTDEDGDGEVVAVNSELVDQPQSVNDDPYDAGWMIKIRPAESTELEKLLTADQYSEQTGE